jgi:hypothetical protein
MKHPEETIVESHSDFFKTDGLSSPQERDTWRTPERLIKNDMNDAELLKTDGGLIESFAGPKN